MGARSFMVAARVPMARDGFEAWLRAPLPGLDRIENPAAMYAGWDAEGTDPDWDLAALDGYPAADAVRADRSATPLDRLAARAAQGFTLARHRDEALEIYLYDYYDDAHRARTDLLMLAGVGRFAPGAAEAPVLYWGGDVHPGLPLPGQSPLAVLLVGAERARFTDRYPVGTLVADLGPVEAAFLTAVEHSESGGSSDGDGGGGGGESGAELLDVLIRDRLVRNG
ncbi:hypothetical protein ACIQPQ_23035 [Streptomyces sp. NPDC091281]|uniref:hypothetical protein n=1 Tax=Streptomyces sp. NPDC091281 TaxID=3365985 RepID=UPI0037FFC0F2